MTQTFIRSAMRKPISMSEQTIIAQEKRHREFINDVDLRYGKEAWKICVDHPFKNCDKVYPFQQKKVAKLIDAMKSDANIKRIIIFGSSVTDRCHAGSDVDVFVELSENKKLAFPAFDFVYDLWTNFTVSDEMMDEINDKGVTVYERDIVG